jgi:NADH:ubiquinone oxidoreductase subunit 4 (subunit M)
LFVGSLISRTYSRLLDSLWFLNGIYRGLFLFFILFNISFPGSFNFVGELLSIIAIVSIDYIFALFVLLSAFLSSLLWLLILNRKLPYHSFYFSFNYIEFFVFLFLILVVVFAGIYFIV